MMEKVRVKIVPDLIEVYRQFWLDDDEDYPYHAEPGFIRLAERISGQEVEVTFTGGDAFEVVDNTFWLPDCCWERVDDVQEKE